MRSILLLLAIGVCIVGQGQTTLNNNLFLRINPLGLIDMQDQNISVGAEVRLDSQWTTGSDIAWIFASAYFPEANGSAGFIARPFIRYYFGQNNRGFFDVEFHYKQVRYTLEEWVGQEWEDGLPAYEQLKAFHYYKLAYGFHLKFGTKTFLSKDKKLLLEYYAGIGIRTKKNRSDAGNFDPFRGMFNGFKTLERFTGPAMPVGARLLFAL